MKQIESNLICIEKECKLNRMITNWNDLQLHYYSQHKVYSQEKFVKKFNQKKNQLNENFRIQIEDNISEQIAIQEKQIQQRIKSLFQNFYKIYIQLLLEQFELNEEQEQLSFNYSFESNLNKYIDIYYCQLKSFQQYQLQRLEEIKYQLNGISYDFMNFVDALEENHKLEIQQSQNNKQNKQEDLHNQAQIQSSQNKNQVEFNQYDYQYSQQLSNFNTYPIQLQNQGYQNIEKQQQLNQQYPQVQHIQKQQIYQQLYEKSKELQTNLQQQSSQQITQFDKTQINNDSNRISFQLPSDAKNIDSYQNKPLQILDSKENSQQQNKQTKEEVQQIKQQNQQNQIDRINLNTNIIGKKFDLTNSDKHLKYSLRFTQFSCVQEGVALVEGAFNLDNNAQVKFKFSGKLDKVLTASFGMINVDQQGYQLGTLNYWMDQSGLLYQNKKSTQGQLKIDLIHEFILEYKAEKRLLTFRKQNIIEQIYFEESVSGSFKFFVKLYGLEVQIIK